MHLQVQYSLAHFSHHDFMQFNIFGPMKTLARPKSKMGENERVLQPQTVNDVLPSLHNRVRLLSARLSLWFNTSSKSNSDYSFWNFFCGVGIFQVFVATKRNPVHILQVSHTCWPIASSHLAWRLTFGLVPHSVHVLSLNHSQEACTFVRSLRI